jgi:glycosyltransferase involved in cell wall biosynthesis
MKKFISTIKHQRDSKLIRDSQLFDDHYYATHYPEFAESKLSALDHYVKVGSAAGNKPNAFFDDAYYRQANPDIAASKTNPLVHFIKFGAKEGRNPSRLFNTRLYLQTHPDVAETGVNPLWHFLRYGAAENRETDESKKQALSDGNRALYAELVKLEPKLPPFADLEHMPIIRHPVESLAGRAYKKLIDTVRAPFTHLLVLQRLMRGGAATLSMYYADLIKQKTSADSVFVLLTDLPDDSAAHLLPAGVSMIVLDKLQPGLSEEEKIQVLTRFIIEMQPHVVHNIDSRICWEAFRRYHRQFRPLSKLVASLFMFTFNAAGAKAGYASDYLNCCIDNLDLILTDNQIFKNEAAQCYALEQRNLDKIAIVYTPILSRFYAPRLEDAQSKRILWSSRLHPDKRPDLLAEIARLMPDYTFEIYGSSALSESEMTKFASIRNIRLHGPYASSDELPREGIAAYLHTTKHEGGAITMKEAIAAGLPAIAPPLGLIPDIINSDTGWLVTSPDDPAAYAAAIRECLSDQDERLRRVRNAQHLLQTAHSWESFQNAVTGLDSYRLGHQPCEASCHKRTV